MYKEEIQVLINNNYIFFDFEILEDYYSFTYSRFQENPIRLINPSVDEIYKIINNKVLVGYNCDKYDSFILYLLMVHPSVNSRILRRLSDFIINPPVNAIKTLIIGNSTSLYSRKVIEDKTQLLYFKELEEALNKIEDLKESDRKFIYELIQIFTGVRGDKCIKNTYGRFFNNYGGITTKYGILNVRFLDLMSKKISIKSIDLYLNDTQQVFDFNKYTTFKQIEADGLQDTFLEYEINDVKLLCQVFNEIEHKTFGVTYHELINILYPIIVEHNITININLLSNIANKCIEYLFFEKSDNKIDLIDSLDSLKHSNNKLSNDLIINHELIAQSKTDGGVNLVKTGVYEGNLLDIDITSMYPNIMLLEESKLAGFKSEFYREILKERIRLKKEDPNNPLVQAYKILLNSTFGRLAYISKTPNKDTVKLITNTGRYYIYLLAIALEEKFNCQFLQIATDGILAKYDDNIDPNDVLEYAKKVSILPIDEISIFNKLYIPSKNNYFAINKTTKDYKSKGFYKEKKGIDTILPAFGQYYTNELISEIFNLKNEGIVLADVNYIYKNYKGKLYPTTLGDVLPKNYTSNKDDSISYKNQGLYLYQQTFKGEYPSEIKQLLKYIKYFVGKTGEQGKISYTKGKEPIKDVAIYSYLNNVDNCTGLSIKSNNNLLIVDVDDSIDISLLDSFNTFYTFNPLNNHCKIFFDISKYSWSPKHNKKKRDSLIISYIQEILNNSDLSIELTYGNTKKLQTVYRDGEVYSNKSLNELPISLKDLIIYKTIATTEIETLEEEKQQNIHTDNLKISDSTFQLLKENNYNLQYAYDTRFYCPSCSRPDYLVYENSNNIFIAGCKHTGCDSHNINKNILKVKSKNKNTEINGTKCKCTLFKMFNEYEDETGKFITNTRCKIPYRLIEDIQYQYNNNIIFKNLVCGNNIKAGVGLGKTHALGYLCLYYGIMCKKTAFVTGETHESTYNLFNEIKYILEKNNLSMDLLSMEYLDIAVNLELNNTEVPIVTMVKSIKKLSKKTEAEDDLENFTDEKKNTTNNIRNSVNTILIIPTFRLKLVLKIEGTEGSKLPKFVEELRNGTRKLVIDEAHKLSEMFNVIHIVKAMFSYATKSDKYMFKIMSMYDFNEYKNLIKDSIDPNLKIDFNEPLNPNRTLYLFNTLAKNHDAFHNCDVYEACGNYINDDKTHIDFGDLSIYDTDLKDHKPYYVVDEETGELVFSGNCRDVYYSLIPNEIILDKLIGLNDYVKNHIDKIWLCSIYFLTPEKTQLFYQSLTFSFKHPKFIKEAIKLTATPPVDELSNYIDIDKIRNTKKIKNIHIKIISDINSKRSIIDKPNLDKICNFNRSYNDIYKDNLDSKILCVIATRKSSTMKYANDKKDINFIVSATNKISNRNTIDNMIDCIASTDTSLTGANMNEYNHLIIAGAKRIPIEYVYLFNNTTNTFLNQTIGRICRENKDDVYVYLSENCINNILEYLEITKLELKVSITSLPRKYQELYRFYKKELEITKKNVQMKTYELKLKLLKEISIHYFVLEQLKNFLKEELKTIYINNLNFDFSCNDFESLIVNKKQEDIFKFLFKKPLIDFILKKDDMSYSNKQDMFLTYNRKKQKKQLEEGINYSIYINDNTKEN